MSSQDREWLLREKYHGEKTEAFLTDVSRLTAGEPLAYVIGHVPFLGCRIYLDSRPLIPRVETEYWTEQAIEEIRKSAETPRILDLCAGSGCIGVAVAKAIPTARVDFVEVDPLHHPTIEKNLRENGIGNSRVFGGNLFEEIADQYDFILSNPPYIDPALDRAEDSVKSHEPHLALYGGTDGLEILKEILNQAPQYLKENGQLWVEHEPEQADEIARLGRVAGFSHATAYEDQYGVSRVSVLVR